MKNTMNLFNKIIDGMHGQLCIMHYALCIAVTGMLLGCTFEQEDYFDESASLRITHMNEQIKDRLVAQSSDGNYGWVIQYFVSGTDDYNFEGFNLFGRFYDDNKVTLASDHRFLRNGNANKYTEYTSNYEMLAEEGPVLSFNTWNDILTVFEDPVDPSKAPNSLADNGEGMHGDHNLVLSSFEDNCLTFHGERHGARVRFIPCDRPWQEYIDDTNKLKDFISSGTYSDFYVVGPKGDTLYFKNVRNGIITYCERLEDPLFPSTINCVFSPNGFRLHHENEINGTKFQEFRMAADSTCLLSADDSVKVMGCWDNNFVNDVNKAKNKLWAIDPATLNATQKAAYDGILADMNGLEVKGIGLYSYSGTSGSLSLEFLSGGKSVFASIQLGVMKTSYGRVELSYNSAAKANSNLTNLGKKNKRENVEPLMRELAASLVGTYELTPDNYFLPTAMTLKQEDGTAIYKLNNK